MHGAVLIVFWLGVLAIQGTAQGTAPETAVGRRAIAGRVVDHDGKPAAGAEVALWWSSPNGEAFAPADLLRLRADDHGRFRAELLPGLGYSALAVGAAVGADGWRGVSALLEDVVAGRGIELKTAKPRAPVRVHVAQCAAWTALGPLRLRVAPAARNGWFRDVALAADGTAELPPWPERFLLAELRLGERLLDRFQVDLEPADASAVPEVPLAPPARLPVLVRDEHGAPLAGVTLLRAAWQPVGWNAATFARVPAMRTWVVAGTTDAVGKAELLLPLSRDPFAVPTTLGSVWIIARAAGRRDSFGGFDGCRIEDGHQVAADRREVWFTLAPAERSVRGRVVLPGGAPLRDHPVVLHWHCTVHEEGNDTSFEQHRVVRTDANGRFEFDHLTASCEAHDLELAPLPPTAESARQWQVPAMPALRPWPAAAGAELLLDLGKVRTVPLAVLGLDGLPSPSAVAFVLPIDRRTDPEDPRTRVFLDPAGRAALQVGAGEWLVGVTDGFGWATATLTDEPTPEPLRVQLQPLAELRGKVTFANDTPAVGARFEPDGGGAEIVDDPLTRLIDGIAREINLAQLGRTRAGVDGEFVLRFVTSPRFQLRAAVYANHLRVGTGVLVPGEGVRYVLK